MNKVNEIALRLNALKLEYPVKIPEHIIREAIENNIVIVFGSSDDLIEFRGAIDDEGGAYGGGEYLVTYGDVGYDEQPGKKNLKAIWHDEGNPCFTYETKIPHETFDVWEDGEKYCVGIVFDLKDAETKIEKFLRIVRENPDISIVPMVDSNVVCDDGCCSWLGSFGDCRVDSYVCLTYYGEERFFTRDGDEDVLKEYFEEQIADELGADDIYEGIEKLAREKIENLPWVKAIIVDIDLPEV